jgi:hypothetical protein
MSSRSSSSTPHISGQRGKIAARQQFEIVDQRRHGRIKPVLAGQLQGETLGQGAGKQAGGLELLKPGQHALDLLRIGTQPLNGFRHVSDHVAGSIKLVGKLGGDQALGRLGKGEGDLFGDMIAQGRRPGGKIIKIVAFARPAAIAAGHRFPVVDEFGLIHPFGTMIVGKDIFITRVDFRGHSLRLGIGISSPAGILSLIAFRRLWLGRFCSFGDRVGLIIVGADQFEQRIALDFLFDEPGQLDMTELQQTDRLHQLWRHDQ